MTTVLRVAPIFEGPAALLQLLYCLLREICHQLVEFANRKEGQLFVAQGYYSSVLGVPRRYAITCVLNVGVLIGCRLIY